jgi:hypothetical protein
MQLERPKTTWRLRVAYWISKATSAQAHARVRAPTHTHGRSHVLHMPSHTGARTRKQKYVTLIISPCQQRFRERVSMLRYTYTDCLVSSYQSYRLTACSVTAERCEQ